MSHKSFRRARYEDLAWKAAYKDYKLTKLFGRKGRYLLVHRTGGTTIVPVEGLTNKELLRFVPRGHMRVSREMMTKHRRTR